MQAAHTATPEIISRNPATNERLGSVPVHGARDIETMLGRARVAQKTWAETSFAGRAAVILRARGIALDAMDEIATLIARESGKPFAEAIAMELLPTFDLMTYFATHTPKLLKPERINLGQYELLGRTSRVIYKPLGVIGIIAPWNFPWAIPLGEVVMSLMAGNAVILKPSELTPLVALKIKEVFTQANLDTDLLHIATGDGTTGAALASSNVNKIMFTGSVATGSKVAQLAAQNLTPCVLELGGKDAMIVCRDADVETAAHAAVWGAFANSGQACSSVERCYVHESIADEFINHVVALTKMLRQNTDGDEHNSDLGAMSSARQLAVVTAHIEDAKTRGAQVLIGGMHTELFHAPTVLTNVNETMRVMQEETFGPVLPIKTFKDERQAVELANDSEFGLCASVWTRDIASGQRLATTLEAGTVTVNEVLYTHGLAPTPWGGVKKSGIGRTHGKLGLLELVAPQHIHTNRFPKIKDLWWFNYTPAAVNLFRALARRATTGSILTSTLAAPSAVKRFFEMRRGGESRSRRKG